MGRTGIVAFHWRRSTTVNPARSNIDSAPRYAFRGRDALALGNFYRVRLEGRCDMRPGVLDRGVE